MFVTFVKDYVDIFFYPNICYSDTFDLYIDIKLHQTKIMRDVPLIFLFSCASYYFLKLFKVEKWNVFEMSMKILNWLILTRFYITLIDFYSSNDFSFHFQSIRKIDQIVNKLCKYQNYWIKCHFVLFIWSMNRDFMYVLFNVIDEIALYKSL